MKLLLDNNLSYRLIKKISDVFPNTEHVRSKKVLERSDLEIWKFALDNDFIIVTQDDDFNFLSELYGSPPKVIWIRIGNGSNDMFANLLKKNFETIQEFIKAQEKHCLVLV